MTKAELTEFIEGTVVMISIAAGLFAAIAGASWSYWYWATYQPPKEDAMTLIALFGCLFGGIAVALLTGAVTRTWFYVLMLRYIKPSDVPNNESTGP